MLSDGKNSEIRKDSNSLLPGIKEDGLTLTPPGRPAFSISQVSVVSTPVDYHIIGAYALVETSWFSKQSMSVVSTSVDYHIGECP